MAIKLIILAVGIVIGLGACIWLTRAIFREMAKGWELDAKRRGEHWDRGQERLSERDPR